MARRDPPSLCSATSILTACRASAAVETAPRRVCLRQAALPGQPGPPPVREERQPSRCCRGWVQGPEKLLQTLNSISSSALRTSGLPVYSEFRVRKTAFSSSH